uniref:tRNA splicing endonuclease subunit 15 n=1 Tax=Accipiter nisus TaxID=211598 RepID=A0A8B9MN04_9AVES
TGERMEPAAGPAERGCGPAGGTSAGGRESGGQGDWAGGAGGNWMATHPTFTEMMSLDISDSAQIYAAFVVYLDLLEGRNWHEVKHVGVAELQLVCLHAREREQDSLQVMVPVPVHISLSHERLLMPWSRGEGGGDKGVSEESNTSACEQSYSGCCKHTSKVEIPLIF